jgi:GNAT superfamily N-acetyltransferase
MIVQFATADHFQPGQVLSLLSEAWAEIWSDELERQTRQFDNEVYENPTTVGACTFITTLDDVPVGMFSWDPRNHPDFARIGWNCVLPRHRGLGIGKTQVTAMLTRFRKAGFRKVLVTTGDHPFFVPAQKMYLACGFTEISRRPAGPGQSCGCIDYEMPLQQRDRLG